MWKVIRYSFETLTWIFRLTLLSICFIKLFYGDYAAVILFLLGLAVTLIPVFINQTFKTKIHWFFDFMFTYLFTYHLIGFLGLYDILPIADDIGHVLGMLIVASLGFFLAYSYNYSKYIKITLPMIGFFTIMWGMGFGAIWEIIEFMWDVTVTMSGVVTASGQYSFSQNGLFDTMVDLTWDLLSSVLAVIICSAFVSRAKKRTIDSIVEPVFQIINRKKVTS